MPLDTSFRLSLYLMLALACAALGVAEFDLLPEAGVVAAAVLIALAVLFRLETKVQLLSIPAANRLGLILGLANLVWAVFRMLRELNHPEMTNTEWPILGLALIGPLVMTLMPAKLARREKHAGDYWWLHGLALATAALAGAMAEGFLAFVLLGFYALFATWNLAMFYVRLSSGSIRPLPGRPAPAVATASGPDAGRGRTLGHAAGFAIAAALVALPLYLVTPRSGFEKLEFGKPRIEIGYSGDQMVDLNKTGDLKPNLQPAFEVTAETAAGPKTDLPADQRWRGRVMRRYHNGVWQDGDLRMPAVEPAPRIATTWSPPHLGDDQCTLTFTLGTSLRERILADPIAWAEDEPVPVATITPNGYRPWFWSGTGSFLSDVRARPPSGLMRYVQVWRTEPDADLSPPLRLIDLDKEAVLRPLRQNPVPRVKDYADALVEKMVRDGKLPADHANRGTLLPRGEFHDRIARAFTAHLANSPDFRYTTELRREKKTIDPIEEFLFHTKSGHCERFATALVLMLRSQGIPAVYVRGFKGCEAADEPGKYVVRQEHAHAWVEALIEEYEPTVLGDSRRTSRWRTLDPTPGGDPGPASDHWTDRAESWIRNLYSAYFLNYTPEQRQKALEAVANWFTRAETLAGLAVLAALPFAIQRFRRWKRTASAGAAPEARWLDPLFALLAAKGYAPQPGETPLEFAVRAGEWLKQSAPTQGASEVPLEWVLAYYEMRFGAVPIAADRQAQLDTRLEQLRAALAAGANS